jgi:hypothetical protein
MTTPTLPSDDLKAPLSVLDPVRGRDTVVPPEVEAVTVGPTTMDWGSANTVDSWLGVVNEPL